MTSDKIFIITHKKFHSLARKNSTLYFPLLVGVENGNTGENFYLKDNNGKNISSQNESYCELTGLYWIWQNTSANIVGLEHYRRYLVDNNLLLKKEEIDNVLEKYDIILPQKTEYLTSSAKHFSKYHDPLVLVFCRDIISKVYPEYVKDFDWFTYQKCGYSYNMFISKKSLIDNYCNWLFNILFELEKEVDLSRYDDYNKRMFGFVAERLFNVWIHHQNLRVKEYSVLYTGPKVSVKERIKAKLIRTVHKL